MNSINLLSSRDIMTTTSTITDCISAMRSVDIAKKHGVSESTIAVIRTKIAQLTIPPRFVDGRITCTKCGKEHEKLNFKNGMLACSDCIKKMRVKIDDRLTRLYAIFDNHVKEWIKTLTQSERDFLNKLDGDIHG